MSMKHYIGIDVGTGSVRGSIFNETGDMIKQTSCSICTWEEKSEYFVQSTEEIWKAVAFVVQEISKEFRKEDIRGIGFDATCSLAVFDENSKPLSVCPSGSSERNVILWMDHRAVREAEEISSTDHEVLKHVGGKMSPEMQMPKLLWLKKNKAECWKRISRVFDLPDFLTWRATGEDSRSFCSLVCKWGFLCRGEHDSGWSTDFLSKIGLQDLLDGSCSKIGSTVLSPGHPIKGGLSEAAANELGLLPGTAVATSIIDAHAGALGMIACNSAKKEEFERRLGLICGTSACHMSLSKMPKFISGIWGPYYGAILPGYWLNEAGQSVTGKLIDHIIQTHPAFSSVKLKAGENGVYKYLEELVERLCLEKEETVENWSKSLHVYPDFHGNRSPLADPDLKGMICGLTLGVGEADLAKLYIATVQALAYGTRQIIESLENAGYEFKELVMCGGQVKSKFFVQTHADVLQISVLLPLQSESMLLGSAILARHAAGDSESIMDAACAMAGPAETIHPRSYVAEYHDAKYEIFKEMLQLQEKARVVMCRFS